jgi:hypothetical protein
MVPGLLLLLPACSSQAKPPKVYLVKGKVELADGQPLTRGLVEFRPLEEEAPASAGEIGPDGSFSLITLVNNRKYPGASVGPHKVTVIVPPNPDQSGGGPIPLPDLLSVEPNNNNLFTLRIERLAPQ